MNIVFVHAHPDDETIATGALIRHLVEAGEDVSVVTATRGEMGGVVPGPLSHLAGTPDLVPHRERELAGALEVLGIGHHAFLGTPPARSGPGERRYLDSGMQWISDGVAGPGDQSDERSLYAANPAEVVADLVAWLRHMDAGLVISYDADGGYGHPDHVRCHEVATAAAAHLGLDFAAVVHEPAESVVWFELEHLLPVVVEALRHHASQLSVSDNVITHSGGQQEQVYTSVGLRGEAASVLKLR